VLTIVVLAGLAVAEIVRRAVHLFVKHTLIVVIVLVITALGGLWLYSHLSPASFGSCRPVPLRFGTPYVRECQPYGASDFAVLFGVATVLLLLLLDRSFRLDTPFGSASVGEAIRDLQNAPLEAKEANFLEALPELR
jgi:hypothetical protein